MEKTKQELVEDMLKKEEIMIRVQNDYLMAKNRWKMYCAEKEKKLILSRSEVHLSDKKPKQGAKICGHP